jgi:hypothetical protein
MLRASIGVKVASVDPVLTDGVMVKQRLNRVRRMLAYLTVGSQKSLLLIRTLWFGKRGWDRAVYLSVEVTADRCKAVALATSKSLA